MKKARLIVAGAVVFLAAYSCDRFSRTQPPPSEVFLATTGFQPAGPPFRVRLSTPTTFELDAPAGARLTFPDTDGAPVVLSPRRELVRFEGGKAFWGEKEFGRRVRIAPGARTLRINDKPYAGTIELVPEKQLAINELSCEEYLLGVVGNEARADFELAALRAQAIASRTYATYQWSFRKNGEYHLVDTTASQVYGGAGEVPERVRRAVAETCGLVLTYEGRIFQAYYHSTCGGNTTVAQKYFNEPDIPPLRGASCIFCRKSPAHDWVADFHERSVRDALAAHAGVRECLAKAGQTLGKIVRIEPATTAGDIYPEYLRVVHENGSCAIHAPVLRSIINGIGRNQEFKSPALTAGDVRGDILHLEGHGWGHGVGMCQYGAQGQALDGKDFFAILLYYYPDATLMRAWAAKPAMAVAALEP